MNAMLANDSSRRYRVLFIRSHNKVFGSSVIAGGLRMIPQVEFAQYPPWPSHYQAKLKKLDDPDAAWEDLHVNLIHQPQELAEHFRNSSYDLILLADHNARLFQRNQAGWMSTLKTWKELFQNIRTDGLTTAWKQRQYNFSLSWSLSELSRFAPVVVVDFIDHPYLTSGDLDLLESCQAYFKREIPYDRFVLYHQNQQRIKSYPYEKKVALLDKIRSIPLGIRDQKFQVLRQQRVTTQDIDVFWCGKISNTLRITAVKHLEALSRQKSWNIVIMETPVAFDEYCRMIARSKITVSIAGAGWDCFRHYEAAALGSLPLMNRPTVEAVWWNDLPEEIFFENHFSNFTTRLETLLADAALRNHALAAIETMIQKHALWSKIVNDILETSLKECSRRFIKSP